MAISLKKIYWCNRFRFLILTLLVSSRVIYSKIFPLFTIYISSVILILGLITSDDLIRVGLIDCFLYLCLHICFSFSYFFIFFHIFSYFFTFLHISSYFFIFLHIIIFLHISSNYHISSYFFILSIFIIIFFLCHILICIIFSKFRSLYWGGVFAISAASFKAAFNFHRYLALLELLVIFNKGFIL